jgi:hypothetical protein
MQLQRLLWVALLVLATAGCGGRTGLGVWIDGGGPGEDAGLGDGQVPDGGGDALDDGGPTDGPGRQDAATGKNCAQIMMCAFESLGAGFDWQALLACTQGATVDGLTQGGGLIWCMAQNCASMLMGDGGGQMDILMCLVVNCQTEICACDGIGDLIPPGIIFCP